MPRFFLACSLLLISFPRLGVSDEAPFADPTMPYSAFAAQNAIKKNLFAPDQDLKAFTHSRWPVSLLKTFPENPNKNWAMIQGREIKIGTDFLGGKVITLSNDRMQLKADQVTRSLILLDCSNTPTNLAISRVLYPGERCQGMFFALEIP